MPRAFREGGCRRRVCAADTCEASAQAERMIALASASAACRVRFRRDGERQGKS